MRCSVLPLVGAVMVLVAPRVGLGQVVPPDSGAKVRVQLVALPDSLYEGRLLALTGDSVMVAVRGEGSMRLHRRSVARLEVGTPGSRTRSTWVGMGLGLVVGGALGAVIGPAIAPEPKPGEFDFGDEFDSAVGAILFGAAGTAVGGIIGYNHPGTRWRTVPLDVGVSRRGVAVGMAF